MIERVRLRLRGGTPHFELGGGGRTRVQLGLQRRHARRLVVFAGECDERRGAMSNKKFAKIIVDGETTR